MATKVYVNKEVNVNDEGFLTDPSQWSVDIAREIAKEEGILLTPKHLEVINYIRERVLKGETISMRSINKSGIVNVKELYELFPNTPLKLACKIAGVSKPASCV
ncbi:MAG TPA: TusE/DsrC/DsvC family sulfur relay protein [Bacteroidales bacterium]|jgi:tRNA 2-thiouridine synthesizing protein E|nr:TusE/DsrC/DsvC family sulfur relay protein [Bacteroidales bacterium]